ncbi:MAG: bifunctional ADP-dependent NAD(P)H-hydrate dehydratase/NAD(P)H-hydrate epimerase, partial [Betaproteobacteria bacterium]|nr:bifunctional ADP-dependent NAD(P)H-hydrate dehydratase/NAD(P)H-hydrate epimerase [Betaproteobacteria bacterium]
MSHRLASIATLRAIEIEAKATLPDGALMARAGAAAARVIARRLKDLGFVSGRIVILLGPGDNGSDGRIAAQALHPFGYTVDCLAGASFTTQLDASLGRPRPIAIVDALFGIGLSRP